jgi:predicted RNase H-like nuclease
MRFIGLDLAWGSRNPTGAAVIEGDAWRGRLLHTQLLGGDDEVIGFVRKWAGDGPTLIAIDAPLRVPNETGRRPGEAEIGKAFAKYQAGAHPANRARLAVNGVVRGEAIVAALEQIGFVHRAEVVAQLPVRQVIEVFPHPAIVSIFDLPRTIKYKAKPNRSHEQRLDAFGQYRGYLRDLRNYDPALVDADELLDRDPAVLIKARLKDYEDLLDALMCAYIAHYLWRWGMDRARVFGDFEGGYITTPIPRSMWDE